MRRRDTEEAERASTPLELLVDLVFVVAVSQSVEQLAHNLEAGDVAEGIVTFGMVFFAIWWAWMNFSWFASSYDVDDGPYRLTVLLQMTGVLALAAGVASAESDHRLTVITVGYCVMRAAGVIQWLRAARNDPSGRATALRYARGIAFVQILWVGRLALPATWELGSFIACAAIELLVPWWAERAEQTAWHPHHIAERYSLFTIILLGESVADCVTALHEGAGENGLSGPLVSVAICGLVVVFALWWIYFLDPMHVGLRKRRHIAFSWGYGHVGVFIALALVGSGLEVVIADAARPGGGPAADSEEIVEPLVHLSPLAATATMALPIALYLVSMILVFRLSQGRWNHLRTLAAGAAVIVVLPATTLLGCSVVVTAALITLALVVVTATLIRSRHLQADHHPDLDGEKPAELVGIAGN
ncbi:MAG: low temperature requirement protein A [Propionibacteriaceae bacterium]|jgi:low temperature requirement protein LtrA|nr:low temperature requirement protein A [Propionibacteriaceae bacterium]